MIKHLLLFTLLLSGGCQNSTSKSTDLTISKIESECPDIFVDRSLNKKLCDYLKLSGNSYEGDKIHTITFDSSNVVIFSGLLCVDPDNLIGHFYYKNDVILIYEWGNSAKFYLKTKELRTDTIKGFQYLDDVDNLPPFDPISKEYDLTNFKKS